MRRLLPCLSLRLIASLAFFIVWAEAGVTALAPQNFGDVVVQGAAAAIDVPVSIPGLSANPSFSIPYQRDFTLGTSVCQSASSCSVHVTFSPKKPGLCQSALVVKDASGNSVGVVLLYGIGLAPQISIHPGAIATIAGTGLFSGSYGDGGSPNSAALWNPEGIAVDATGNIFVSDTIHQALRIVSGGVINTVPGTRGVLTAPAGIAVDGAGNVYVADPEDNVVREVSASTATVTIVAGGGHPTSGIGDGGPAINAKLSGPSDVAVDGLGNLFIADTNNGLIREVNAAGTISTVVGGGASTVPPWGDGGPALGASLASPRGIALDPGGNLYIADTGHHAVRYVVLSTGVISSIAGNGSPGYSGEGGPAAQASLYSPVGLKVDAAGDVYIADSGNNMVREVLAGSGVIITVAGNGSPTFGGDGGSPLLAGLYTPMALALDGSGNLFIADSANNVIREVTFGPEPMSFAAVTVGLASASQAETVFNTGNRPLTFSALNVSASFREDTSNASACSATSVVLRGRSCTIAVQSAPVSPGTSTGTVALTTNAGTQTITLSGSGMSGPVAQVQISPAALTFASQAVGTVSSAQTVTLKNTGSADLSISSIWLAGANSSSFQITANTCGRAAAGSSCTVAVVFAPVSVGSQSAAITFTDGLASSPQSVVVVGTAIRPSTFSSLTMPQNTSIQIGDASMGLLFAMQGDGNLVLYQNGAAVWNSGTPGQNCAAGQCHALFTADGNLVVYNGANAIWNSGTAGNPGAQLVFSGQAPYVRIVGADGSMLWLGSYTFNAGTFLLNQGAIIRQGALWLAMQGDGNLVLYQGNAPVWWSGTSGQNCGADQCFAVFQGDGNFVVYNGAKPLWNSGTPGNPGAQFIFSKQAPYLRIVGADGSMLWPGSYAYGAGTFQLNEGSIVRLGALSLAMQGDGNLVLYQGNTPVWWSGTSGQNCGTNQCFAAFQGDGNLVVYNASTPIWNSATPGNPGAQFVFSNQPPYLQIIGTNRSILWTTPYRFRAGGLMLNQGMSINMGPTVLVMQGDGNLVMYKRGTAVWNSGTPGQNCSAQCWAVLQGDGNFVIYNGSRPIWNSGTPGHPGAQLVLSDSPPYVEIVDNSSPVWQSRFLEDGPFE